MRFSLHQQNYKPNCTAGRHKPGGINLAGASHPQLPKAQYARGPSIHHTTPVLCMVNVEGGPCLHVGGWVWLPREALVAESTGHTAQHHRPSRQAHTESKGVNKHPQSCTQLCHTQAARQREAKGDTEQVCNPLQQTEQISSKSSLSKGNWGGLTKSFLLSSEQMSSGGTKQPAGTPILTSYSHSLLRGILGKKVSNQKGFNIKSTFNN